MQGFIPVYEVNLYHFPKLISFGNLDNDPVLDSSRTSEYAASLLFLSLLQIPQNKLILGNGIICQDLNETKEARESASSTKDFVTDSEPPGATHKLAAEVEFLKRSIENK